MSNPNIQDLQAIDQQTPLLEQAILAGNLEEARTALEAGARTEGALELAIFYNPRNRLQEGVTREWCEWMGLDPDEYTQKSYCKIVETPKPGEVYLGDGTYLETYPNLPIVELLMQHGADPDFNWSGLTTFTLVVNYRFLNAGQAEPYKEYQAILESIVDQLLPAVRLVNLNLLDWSHPRMHPSLLEKIWSHVLLHQIEQPPLEKPALKAILKASQNPNQTMRQLITLKGLTWEHFKNLPEYTDILPSLLTLEFAMDQIHDPNIDWGRALGRLLNVACHRKHWLYAGDLIRLGAVPRIRKFNFNALNDLISIYPKEYLNQSFNGHTIMSAVDKLYSGNKRAALITALLERGAEPIPKLMHYDVVSHRSVQFRYVLLLAELANLAPNKVNWTAPDAQTNPLYLFKRLPREVQQYLVFVGFMAPSKIKGTNQFRAPSRDHAVRTFLKLKKDLPTIQKNIEIQRRQKTLHTPLRNRHMNLVCNSANFLYRKNSRKRTGFYTLFHANRAWALHSALEVAPSLEKHLLIINHQLSFFRGEKSVTGDPYVPWNQDAWTRIRLSQKFKRYPVKSRIGYYGMLKKMQQEAEAALQEAETGIPVNAAEMR